MQAGLGDQPRILQVALAPAAVALQFGQQVRRLLFPAAGQIGHQPHLPAGAAHQRGFDEVVREDLAGQPAAAGDGRQPAVRHERRDADDRVVAPVVRFAELPELHAGAEQTSGDAAGELLRAGIAACRHRRPPAPTAPMPAFGCASIKRTSPSSASPAHHAVGVQHHHVAVFAAPAAAEIGDVAGLALAAAQAPAVMHAQAAGREAVSKCQPGLALGGAQRRLAAVGQHVDLGQPRAAFGDQRLGRGSQPGEDRRHVLVADRHHDGGARVRRDRVVRHARVRQHVPVALAQHAVAHCGRDATGGDPREQQREQQHLRDAQRLRPYQRLRLQQQRRGGEGGQQHQRQQQRAAQDRGALPAAQPGWRAAVTAACTQALHQAGPEAEPRRGHHRAALQRRRARMGVAAQRRGGQALRRGALAAVSGVVNGHGRASGGTRAAQVSVNASAPWRR